MIQDLTIDGKTVATIDEVNAALPPRTRQLKNLDLKPGEGGYLLRTVAGFLEVCESETQTISGNHQTILWTDGW